MTIRSIRRAAGIAAIASCMFATQASALVVNRVNGVDDKWSATAAVNLRYCVSKASFSTRYSTAVTAIANAAAAWQGAAKVKFIHVPTLDTNCTNATAGVAFNVRYVATTSFLMRSFFPSTARSGRELKFTPTSFEPGNSWSLTGATRHELGHALGFRHEHTRPEAGVCFEDMSWRALTSYDSNSVMHYADCHGTNTGDLVLTAKDKYGARALYGAP